MNHMCVEPFGFEMGDKIVRAVRFKVFVDGVLTAEGTAVRGENGGRGWIFCRHQLSETVQNALKEAVEPGHDRTMFPLGANHPITTQDLSEVAPS